MRGGPPGRILVQTGPYEIDERIRHAGEIRLLLGDPEEMGVQAGVRGAEEETPGGRVDQQRAQTEHIGRRSEFQSAHLLRRHEAGRADQHAGARVQAVPGQAVHRPRDPEVDDAGPVHGDQDVGRLEVTMDQARLVHGLQREGETVGEGAHRLLGQRSEVLGHDGGQVGARNVLRRHPRHGRLGVGVQDIGGPGSAHAPGSGHLAGEPAAELGVLGVFGLHDLDGHRTAQVGPAQVHQAHPARAEAGDQAVRPYVRGVVPRQVFHGGGQPFGFRSSGPPRRVVGAAAAGGCPANSASWPMR